MSIFQHSQLHLPSPRCFRPAGSSAIQEKTQGEAKMSWLERVGARRRTRPAGVTLILSLGLILSVGLAPARVVADVATPDARITPDQSNAIGVDLPYTDGFGLLPKPPDFSKEESNRFFAEGKRACDGPCVTPFGAVLGVADGAEGRSNCVSTCIRPEYSFLDRSSGAVSVHADDPKQDRLQYIGVTYQCVEYARKWWMKNRGITFGSVDSANEILYLTAGKNLETQQSFPLARSINGTARRPPRRGDLVVYYPDRADPEWRHGHAAVVVAVDLEQDRVSLAEENYDNRPWRDPQAFARQIRLFEVGGRYTLLDVAPTANRNAEGGRIAGWLYPLAEQ